MRKTPATLLCDFYKISHKAQYPDNTEKIFATWTPRGSRLPGVNKVVSYGFQRFVKEFLIDYFNENFFNRKVEDVIGEYERVIKYTLNVENVEVDHLIALHKLGYLPIKMMAIKEGTRVPLRVPMMTIENTSPEFFWLTNYLESLLSAELWQGMTAATISREYRQILEEYAIKTCGSIDFVPFQGHDFSFRGMEGHVAAEKSGMGHLLNFVGTDTISAILGHENYYSADIMKELVGCSVWATEHSVMCANTNGEVKDEYDTYKRIITDIYPNGIVSVVSDTWDLWKVLTETIPKLKKEILARDGKVVIRPDSGDPVKIISGYKCTEIKPDNNGNIKQALWDAEDDGFEAVKFEDSYYLLKDNGDFEYGNYVEKTEMGDELSESEVKGIIELLWETFSGTITEQGFKVLDSHIGAIYGDAITVERCTQISERLMDKGFASINVVYGIGSFTYQYNTRDTFGFAMKTTYSIIDGKEYLLYKDPVTDDGLKKSQRGLVIVYKDSDGNLNFKDGLNQEDYDLGVLSNENLLEVIFEDGVAHNLQTLAEVRDNIRK